MRNLLYFLSLPLLALCSQLACDQQTSDLVQQPGCPNPIAEVSLQPRYEATAPLVFRAVDAKSGLDVECNATFVVPHSQNIGGALHAVEFAARAGVGCDQVKLTADEDGYFTGVWISLPFDENAADPTTGAYRALTEEFTFSVIREGSTLAEGLFAVELEQLNGRPCPTSLHTLRVAW